MIQMILFALIIILHTCYGTSGNFKRDLDIAWSGWNRHFNGDYSQYVGKYEGMENNMNMHSKIKAQYLSAINNIRDWHNAKPLKEIKELDDIAQSYANYITQTGNFEVGIFNNVFGLLVSSNEANEDVGKKVPFEIYSNFDKGDTPFDFEANEEEMVKNENVEDRRSSMCMIWKSATNIGIGVAKTYQIQGTFYIIVAAIYPKSNELGKYKENITPRNLEAMTHYGYFENLQKEKERNKSFIRIEVEPWVQNIIDRLKKNVFGSD
ncbi:uncharacterized protein LOC126902336 [Daktulosphaira vitifoliae]|uniref:uncharacterized protein LOC126902336 n=1 Tax=Daktulosphaira vitifoliae TaxID=58002 RepID=UPI0021AA05DF|nr:uncharacterized protein LOC126902336 [Daktulosphaira vitifoliae]